MEWTQARHANRSSFKAKGVHGCAGLQFACAVAKETEYGFWVREVSLAIRAGERRINGLLSPCLAELIP